MLAKMPGLNEDRVHRPQDTNRQGAGGEQDDRQKSKVTAGHKWLDIHMRPWASPV